MKKKLMIATLVATTLLFAGCKQEEMVEINYGESYLIENEKLSKYDSIEWSSDDESIVNVENNTVTGKGPGTAILTGIYNDKVVAEYTFTVNIVPVTSIVLSTNNTTIKVDDGFQLNYSLFPDNASDYGITWKSADDSVAGVNENGYVLAKKVGQTTISASNSSGIMATCSITVEQKSAYERLSDEEKEFVDLILKDINSFYNPDAVKIRKVERKGAGDWRAEIQATNGFGGTRSQVYFVDKSIGIWNWDSLDIDLDVDINPDSKYDIDLINEAIADRR